jgi:hypothetical protein
VANTEWRRADFFVEDDDQAWNTKEMVTIEPGESILRVRWGLQLVNVAVQAAWPAGNIVVKAGIVFDDAAIAVDTAPTPITNPDADWLDMSFVPWDGQISRATNVAWMMFGTVRQREARERRDLSSTAVTDSSVYLSWEWLNGTPTGADPFFERTGTVDALILMP